MLPSFHPLIIVYTALFRLASMIHFRQGARHATCPSDMSKPSGLGAAPGAGRRPNRLPCPKQNVIRAHAKQLRQMHQSGCIRQFHIAFPPAYRRLINTQGGGKLFFGQRSLGAQLPDALAHGICGLPTGGKHLCGLRDGQ